MASSPLKRVFDYKLVFDSLCDSNGMVRLETLTARWPISQTSEPDSKVPHGCVKHWRHSADKDGYLDWSGFSTGLQAALVEDSSRLARAGKPDIPRSKAEQKLASLRLKGVAGQGGPPLMGKVTAGEIESFLSECGKDVLMKALKKMRKEVYKGQLSLHRGASSPRTKSVDQAPVAGEGKRSRPASGSKGGGIASREREELVCGLEMMERTRKWYKDRLKILTTEESQNPSHSKTVKAAELLEVLERGTSTKSEMLSHLKEINGHLDSLSSPAPSLTTEQQSRLTTQLQRWTDARHEKAKPQSLPVGAPPEHVGKAVVEFSSEEQPSDSSTIVVDTRTTPTFPVRTSEEASRRKMATQRASSTTAVNRIGITSGKTAGHRQEKPYQTQPRYASSQNLRTQHSHQDRDSERPMPQRTPKRAHSFTSPTRKSHTELQQSEPTNTVTDYPVHRPPQQYPLRGTTSMQELQPGHRTATTDRHSKQTAGHLSKSLSVRNVSTGNHGSHVSTAGPNLIHQQVYNTGMSHSVQTLPIDRSSDRYRGHHGDGRSQRHVRNQVADKPPQSLGGNFQSIV